MIFGISDNDALRDGAIIVIDAEAGYGKSTEVFNYLKNNGEPVLFCSVSNMLKRHAEKNYSADDFDVTFKTITAGLAVNKNGVYWVELKDVEQRIVVIDEFLLSDPRVVNWIDTFGDHHVVIILTDSHQLLSAGDVDAESEDDKMLNVFYNLIARPDVMYVNLKGTRRARDTETIAAFDFFYEKAETNAIIDYENFLKLFPNVPVIDYNDMPYDIDCHYICKTNEIEYFFVNERHLKTLPDRPLIPKGTLASKPPKNPALLLNYPVLTQHELNKVTKKKFKNKKMTDGIAYVQIANIGSALRMQGSEAPFHLYYLVTPNSKFSMREIYTVITRLYHLKDFTIVVCNPVQVDEIREFRGLPIKHEAHLYLEHEGRTQELDIDSMLELFNETPDTDELYYDKTIIYKKGTKKDIAYIQRGRKFPKGGFVLENGDVLSKVGDQPKQNLYSMAKRSSSMQYSYVGQIYKILDEHDVDRFFAATPHKAYHGDTPRYDIDFSSAYPTLMKWCKMPSEGLLTFEKSDELMNWYIYRGSFFTKSGCLMTDDLANYVVEHNLGTVEYVFSTPYVVDSYLASILWEKATRSQESKESIKGLAYGVYQKQYLKKAPDGSCYIMDETKKYEIFYCAIRSQLSFYQLTMMDKMRECGRDPKYIEVDAVWFNNFDNTEDDMKKFCDEIDSVLPEFIRWKVEDNEIRNKTHNKSDQILLFQNYPQLPTEAEYKKAKRQERYAEENKTRKKRESNMTDEEKAKKKAQDAERARRYRERKKAEKLSQKS